MSAIISRGVRVAIRPTSRRGVYRTLLRCCPACDVAGPIDVTFPRDGDGDAYCTCGDFHVGTLARRDD